MTGVGAADVGGGNDGRSDAGEDDDRNRDGDDDDKNDDNDDVVGRSPKRMKRVVTPSLPAFLPTPEEARREVRRVAKNRH